MLTAAAGLAAATPRAADAFGAALGAAGPLADVVGRFGSGLFGLAPFRFLFIPTPPLLSVLASTSCSRVRALCTPLGL